MSAEPPSKAAIAEVKARRRFHLRLITFGEIVGVLALIIAGLSWWDGHREHVRADREQATAEKQTVARQALLLKASGSGDRLSLQPAAPEQVVQSQSVLLPTELGSPPIHTTGDPRIERPWLEKQVLNARKRLGEASDRAGDQRLPIGVETSYVVDGAPRTDRAIYDLSYTVTHRVIGGDTLALQGLALVRRMHDGELQARLDKLWAERTAAETADALAADKPHR